MASHRLPHDHPAFAARSVAGMTPWACSYRKDGKRFCITLYGTDADQVLQDNCDALDDLTVDGELISSIPVDNETARQMIAAWEKRSR